MCDSKQLGTISGGLLDRELLVRDLVRRAMGVLAAAAVEAAVTPLELADSVSGGLVCCSSLVDGCPWSEGIHPLVSLNQSPSSSCLWRVRGVGPLRGTEHPDGRGIPW